MGKKIIIPEELKPLQEKDYLAFVKEMHKIHKKEVEEERKLKEALTKGYKEGIKNERKNS